MSHYVVGDIQGCYSEFRQLLDAIAFEPTRKSAGTTIFCGHWSTLDLMIAPNVLMLDSGCVWGGPLTAMRLDDGRVFQMPSRAEIAPKPRE